MFKQIALVSLLMINVCYAKELKNYDEVLNAAYQGARLAFVLDASSCEIKNEPRNLGHLISVISQESYNITEDGSILLRDTNPAHKLINYPELGPVTQAYSLQLKKDGSIFIVDNILDPVTYKEKLPVMEEVCHLGNGVKVFAR